MEPTNTRSILIRELYEYFVSLNFRVIAARGIEGVKYPQPFANDGYGDQENKLPDIFAYDTSERRHVIGITREKKSELASDASLTEYNVFLDQVDRITGTAYQLYINLPPPLVGEFNALMREYIHREYWHRIVVMESRRRL